MRVSSTWDDRKVYYSVGWSTHREDDQRITCVLVERYPWWVYVAETVSQWLCRPTRHRACMLLNTEDRLDRYHEQFEVSASPEMVAAFSQWRGWGRPFFMDEDEQEIPYGDDFERMP